MTLIQMRPRSTDATPVHRTAVEAMDAAGPQVCDDMSVEVALAVMAAARTGRLVVCDQDDQRVDLVTRADLTAVRDSGARMDRVRLRDILGDGGAPTAPVITMAKPSTR
ncbi:CBS domain-containing protein [Streptomyces caniscabiei]|uniref:CBS domain-containing protein n=1 Tax=Streptomyces caniscabiei TaxID=2746961 RepID=UPI0029C0A124|nr:CBS domain-containing protein [Streptomyces caniscabiei]